MRGSILCTVVGAAFGLILSANQSYAGAAKTGCTLPLVMVTGTPNSCGVMAPTGTQQVDPPGNIVNPDTTFITSSPIDDFGSGTGNSTFQNFLFPVFDPPFSNNFDGNQSIANSVIEFDGSFTSNGGDLFSVTFNCGSAVQLFVNNVNVTLTPTDPETCPNGVAEDPTDTGTAPDLDEGTIYPFVLDYYTGEGNTDVPTPPEYAISLSIDGTLASDTDPGGTFVPEPASMSIFGAALAGLGIVRRRRKRA